MAIRRSRWKMALPTLTLTAMPFTVFCPVTQAFFPPINNQTVDPPTSPPVIVVPPVSPPPFVPPPPPVIVDPPPPPPDIVVPPPCECHHNTPEPSTLLAGAIGLAAAAGWKASRRKLEKKDGSAK